MFFYNDVKMFSCKGGLWSHNLPVPCSMNNSSSSLHTPHKIEKIYLFPSLVFYYWDVRSYCKCRVSGALLQGPASSFHCELKRICQEKLWNRITSERAGIVSGTASVLHGECVCIWQNSVCVEGCSFTCFVFYEHSQILKSLQGCYLKIYNLTQRNMDNIFWNYVFYIWL